MPSRGGPPDVISESATVRRWKSVFQPLVENNTRSSASLGSEVGAAVGGTGLVRVGLTVAVAGTPCVVVHPIMSRPITAAVGPGRTHCRAITTRSLFCDRLECLSVHDPHAAAPEFDQAALPQLVKRERHRLPVCGDHVRELLVTRLDRIVIDSLGDT